MCEYQPETTSFSNGRKPIPKTVPTGPPETSPDSMKLGFILDYVITARANGRTKDLDGSFYRQDIINCASDLYDRALEASKT